jgi:hypothetical protein
MNKKLKILDLVLGVIALADIARNFVSEWREYDTRYSMTVNLISASVNSVTRTIADCFTIPGLIIIGTAIVLFVYFRERKPSKT